MRALIHPSLSKSLLMICSNIKIAIPAGFPSHMAVLECQPTAQRLCSVPTGGMAAAMMLTVPTLAKRETSSPAARRCTTLYVVRGGFAVPLNLRRHAKLPPSVTLLGSSPPDYQIKQCARFGGH